MSWHSYSPFFLSKHSKAGFQALSAELNATRSQGWVALAHPPGWLSLSSLSRRLPWHTTGFNNPYAHCTIVVVIIIQKKHMSIYTMLLIFACRQAGSLGAVNPCIRHPNTVQSPLLLFSQSIEERQ